MGRSLTTRKYHAFLWRILDELKTRDRVTLCYKTQREAKNVQLDFLAFRTAAVKEGLDQPRTVHTENRFNPEEFVPAMYPELNAYKTRTRQSGDRFCVDFYHMDKDELAIESERQLDELSGEKP